MKTLADILPIQSHYYLLRLKKPSRHGKYALHGQDDYSEPASKNSSLAEATWQEFAKYLSKYQWAFDDPSASPRKAEIAHAIKHRGEKGACTFRREGGWKFVLRPLRNWAFEQAITKNRKIYYVSYGRTILLYFDVDLHQAFQRVADGLKAVEEINRTKLPVYWIDSSRGFNGYLKVDLADYTYEKANKIIDRLEKALRRALALAGNLADFEIKGRVGYLKDGEYDWSCYGKLPIHNRKWSWSELKKFSETPTIAIQNLEKLAEYIEARVPNSVLEQHETYKKLLRSQPRIEDGHFLLTDELRADLEQRGVLREAKHYAKVENPWTEDEVVWIPVKFLQMQKVEETEPEIVQAEKIAKVIPAVPALSTPIRTKVYAGDLDAEPDSFIRQAEALRRYSRAIKRVPNLEEALEFIQTNRLFTGTWDDNFQKRKARVRSTLRFIARTFNPAKCAKGSVNFGKYDAWAEKKFPQGITSEKRRWVTPEGEIVEFNQQIHVGMEFIGIFLAVCELCLLIDQNQDESLPHRRAKAVWNALHAKKLVSESFNDRKWAVCREELVERAVVQITDRQFCPGKAMRWAVGQFFPFLGLWKRAKQPSLLEPVSLGDFLGMVNGETKEVHNTWLLQQPPQNDLRETILASRGPP